MPNPPDGVAVYGWDDLLRVAGLATATMLKEDRLQPGTGQRPDGCYWSGHQWVLVWRREDAVAMPALSPARQRLYDRARTCAECGVTSARPLWLGPDNRLRWCSAHRDLPWRRAWEEQVPLRRQAAAGWAAGVLADSGVVLLEHRWSGTWQAQEVRAETTAGEVLVDARVRTDSVYRTWTDEQLAGTVDASHGRELVAPVAGRRIVSWDGGRWSRLNATLDTGGLEAADGDDYVSHWSDWVGQRKTSPYLQPEDAEYRSYHEVRRQDRPSREPVELVAAMRAGLAEMAAGVAAAEPGDGAGA